MKEARWIAAPVGIALMLGVIAGTWFGYKTLQIWAAEMSGRVTLAEVKFRNMARIEEAETNASVAEIEGQTEIIRAHSAAQANEMLISSLGGSDAYLRYLYIKMLEEQGSAGSVIYVPTEAGIPVLETGRVVQE